MKNYLVLFLFLAFPLVLMAQLAPKKLLIEGNLNLDITRQLYRTQHRAEDGASIYAPQTSTYLYTTPAIGWWKKGRFVSGVGLDFSLQKTKALFDKEFTDVSGASRDIYELNLNKVRTIAPFFYGRYFFPISKQLYFAPKASISLGWKQDKFKTIGSFLDISNTTDEILMTLQFQPTLVYLIGKRFGLQAYFGSISTETKTTSFTSIKDTTFRFKTNLNSTSLQLGFFMLLPYGKNKNGNKEDQKE